MRCIDSFGANIFESKSLYYIRDKCYLNSTGNKIKNKESK